MTIFDMVTSQELAGYWEEMTKDRAPYLGETLFPSDKKLGLDLKWIKGNSGLPVALKLSAFDVKAVPRDRIGIERVSAEMPFFKESMLVDETLRQELNMVLGTGNQAYIDAVMNRVFKDEQNLLEGAAVQRERMRMQLLTTGTIALASNGQSYFYDYGVPENHKGNAAVSWSDTTNADPITDIRGWQDVIEADTGVRPTRAICDRQTWAYITNNQKIKQSIYVLNSGVGFVSDARLKAYLKEELDLEVAVYSKRFSDEAGTATPFVPSKVFSLFPVGKLGTTWYGTTPEESDLMAGSVANVSVVDTGVAITTIKVADPVNVETKVTQIVLPSWETSNQVFIASTDAE